MKFFYMLTIICIAGSVQAQSLNTELWGNIDYGMHISDVWGYSDEAGNEYAIVGLFNAVSFVKIEAEGISEVARVSGASSIWRDIKTHSHYAYITNEAFGGLQIIDMASLPDSVRLVKNDQSVFSSAHNVFIADGYAYISGSNTGAGATILDLVDPENPVLVGRSNLSYYHDVFVQRDTLYASTGDQRGSLAVFDVSDKSAPRQIGEIFIPNAGYSHNAWATADGNYVMTTEETSGKTVKMWDIHDLDNPLLVSEYVSATSLLPHNVHIKGDYAYISHYGDGLRILDIADRTNMVEIGYYDTYPGISGSFDGNWGAFPFTNSGLIYVSDQNTGLSVVEFNGRKAARVQGTVLDSQAGTAIAGATITVSGDRKNYQTDNLGKYKLGFVEPDEYTISFRKSGFDTVEVTVTLAEGDNLQEEISLTSLTTAVEGDISSTPESYLLAQNFPNPFNAGTTIRFAIPEQARVTLRIYDLLGTEIATLVDGVQQQGEHRLNWSGKDAAGRVVPSGIYFYELKTDKFKQSHKMLFVQ